MTTLNLLAITDEFGQGPTASLIHVAREMHLRARQLGLDIRITYAGRGTGLALARREHPDLFQRVVETDTLNLSPASDDLIRSHDVVVSALNGPGAQYAAMMATPAVHINMLSWMPRRDDLPKWIAADYLHNFPGVHERAEGLTSRPQTHIVGPLIAQTLLREPPESRGRNVIGQFGGLATPLMSEQSMADYFDVMATIVARAVHEWSEGGIIPTIAAGQLRVQARLGRRQTSLLTAFSESIGRPAAKLVALSNTDLLSEVASPKTRAVVTVGGMHSMIEPFALGTPALLVPASNASQELAQRIVQERGAVDALNWYDLLGVRLPDTEQGMCDGIVECIATLRATPSAQDRLVSHLVRQLTNENKLRLFAERQHMFLKMLQPIGQESGAAYIADRVLLLGQLQQLWSVDHPDRRDWSYWVESHDWLTNLTTEIWAKVLSYTNGGEVERALDYLGRMVAATVQPRETWDPVAEASLVMAGLVLIRDQVTRRNVRLFRATADGLESRRPVQERSADGLFMSLVLRRRLGEDPSSSRGQEIIDRLCDRLAEPHGEYLFDRFASFFSPSHFPFDRKEAHALSAVRAAAEQGITTERDQLVRFLTHELRPESLALLGASVMTPPQL